MKNMVLNVIGLQKLNLPLKVRWHIEDFVMVMICVVRASVDIGYCKRIIPFCQGPDNASLSNGSIVWQSPTTCSSHSLSEEIPSPDR